METLAVWVVLGLIGAFCLLLVIGANTIEGRYQRMHPPDDWDGMREDRDDEHK